MSEGLIMVAYIAASVLFIFSIAGLSHHETAIKGNILGITGMITAIIATMFSIHSGLIGFIIISMSIGSLVGIWVATKVEMTEMPELIAILHSFVGIAAMLVGFNSFLNYEHINDIMNNIHSMEVFLGIFIGGITFSGSLVAFSKLKGIISSNPLIIPYRNILNSLGFIVVVLLMLLFIHTDNIGIKVFSLLLMTIISILLGLHLVDSVSGADMPVVISMLNSYSGWAATAAGFTLGNDLLIVTGALVGSSGSILSYFMCKSMNRSFINVITGTGVGNTNTTIVSANHLNDEYRTITVEELTFLLKNSNSVIITPGYGMAVAQAQHLIFELIHKLKSYNVRVCFGIHPVAGRLPGHMNVLLAEAKIPYNMMLDLDDINNQFSTTDVVLVIGANDIVNPAAQEEPSSPIAGMPVLQVWNAKHVVVFKRSMSRGYSGIPNDLFFKENTKMVFGDAKDSIQAMLNFL